MKILLLILVIIILVLWGWSILRAAKDDDEGL
jgi:hypothetical protein